jgi:hypothetical protein
MGAAVEVVAVRKAPQRKIRPKMKLGIPDLEHSKAGVLRSLRSPDSRRGYQHAKLGFILTCRVHLDFAPPVEPKDKSTQDAAWDALSELD